VTSRTWDYVVASDVAYDEEIFDDLLKALRTVMAPSTVGLLCNGTRSPEIERQLRKRLEAEYDLAVIDVTSLETSYELFPPDQDDAVAASGSAGAGPGANLKWELRRRVMPRTMNLWKITCRAT